MTPFFTSIPPVDGDQSQDHTVHQHLFGASTPSFPCTTLFIDLNDPGAVDSGEHHFHHDQQEANIHPSIQVSSHDQLSYESKTNTNRATKSSACDQYTEVNGPRDSAKWTPSKMRFMRKMMSHDEIIVRRRRRRSPQGDVHIQEPQDMAKDPQNGIIRVCSDCKTTKTPLWRSGPQGPKSLCNACGIRQRKARRAMAAAAAAAAAVADAGLIPGDEFNKVKNDEEQDAIRILPFKKRCKIDDDEPLKKKKKKFCDDGTTNSSKNAGFLTRFPQDERDAAILLMALSCGLICS